MNRYTDRLAGRPRLYAALAGGLAATLCLLAFIELIALDRLRRLDQTQWHLARTVQGVVHDTRNVLRRLNGQYPPDCSEANLRQLRHEVFLSNYQVDVGVFDAQGQLRCSTVLGNLARPQRLPRPSAVVRTPQGEVHEYHFNLPWMTVQADMRATVVRMGRFSTAIRPYVLDDLFAAEDGALWVRSEDGSFHVVYADPAIRAGLQQLAASPLFERTEHGFSWRERAFVSSRRIPGTEFTAHIVVPLSHSLDEHRAHLALAALLALLVASLVYGVLLPLLQRWGRLEHRIRGLLRDENLLCLYQPIVELGSGRPLGCEVLMRLRDGVEVLSPDRVLPAVEQAGLEWVLDQMVVRGALRELCTSLPPGGELRVAFNFFPANFHSERLHALIGGELARHPAPACELRIALEVIEQSEQGAVAAEISGLRRAGYQISLDDFGTGYSNLASVRALAPDYLKIDKSFVFDMEDASVRSSLIPEMVGIARAVGARVVAEGIENAAQRERLLAWGVDYGQGYLFARPMPIGDFVAWLRQATAAPQ